MSPARGLVPLALALASCPSGGEGPKDAGPEAQPTCPFEFLGDPNEPMELTLRVLGPDDVSKELEEDGEVPLVFPPQGGRVAFVGARAKNLDPCAVRLTGVMRDMSSKEITFDKRTINLQPAPDGWGQSVDADFNTFS